MTLSRTHNLRYPMNHDALVHYACERYRLVFDVFAAFLLRVQPADKLFAIFTQ